MTAAELRALFPMGLSVRVAPPTRAGKYWSARRRYAGRAGTVAGVNDGAVFVAFPGERVRGVFHKGAGLEPAESGSTRTDAG
jgi:hypothetical protein